MNRRRLLLRVVLAVVPAASIGAAVSFFHAVPNVDSEHLFWYTFILSSLVVALSVEALWLLYTYVTLTPRVKRIGRERDFLSQRTKFLEGRLVLLEDDVEVLSAMREVTRAAAAREGLEGVLDDTLTIIQDLLAAEWVTIFVHEEEGDRLVPRAHRRGDKSFHGSRIPPQHIDDTNVKEAYRYGTVIKTVEDDRLQAAIPALSGSEKLGVVAVSAALVGTFEEKSQRIEILESALTDITEHIAYALQAASLQTRAFEDDLTRLGARRLFQERMSELVALSLRKNQALSLVLVDIDHFKTVNDTCGHQAGDRVLQDVAALLCANLRRYDSAYRYGGDEMALLLPQTALPAAAMLAERIRSRLAAGEFTEKKLHITASFGVAALGGETMSEEALLAAADSELYRAKALGRNRVEPAALLGAAKP